MLPSLRVQMFITAGLMESFPFIVLAFAMYLAVLLDWGDPLAIEIRTAMSGVIEQGIECKED